MKKEYPQEGHETLSDKIEIVGFGTDIEFKDIEGNVKIFKAKKGEEGIKVKDVKDAVKKLKEELFGGSRILSDNEMIDIVDKIFGEKLI